MRVERINENQVRFILSAEDLAARQIRLSELAYGTEKARKLFGEMLQQAEAECGFEVDNIPIMIEAIPMRGGSIVLIVTKADNPEELDTRFASFSPSVQQAFAETEQESASPLEQLLHSIWADQPEAGPGSSQKPADQNALLQESYRQFRDFALCNRLYLFPTMEAVVRGAAKADTGYTGESALFRENGVYSLLLTMRNAEEVSAMQSVLAILSEYGTPVPISTARSQYLTEHGHVLLAEDALPTLARLGR